MSQEIVLNGLEYTIPDPGDDSWGENLTDYFVAIPLGVLQKSGGSFILTADVNFGTNFGLASKYFKSISSNIAALGILRLSNTDAIAWRNAGNSADLLLSVDTNNLLNFNGTPIQPAGNYISSLTGDVTASGPGAAAATVVSVGGSSAANVNSATVLVLTAQSGNKFLASPANGSSGVPTFRAVVAADITGQIAIANGGTGQATKQAGFDALSPTTSKGDLIVNNGTHNVAEAVGSDGQVLVADSSQTNGIKWGTNTIVLKAPVITRLISGSGTFITATPTPLYSIVKIQAGGGGGSASGTSPGTPAAGNNSTFGTSFLIAGGGSAAGGTGAGVGGTNTINAGGTTIFDVGGGGGMSGAAATISSVELSGGAGGNSFFGGGGASPALGPGNAGIAGALNTGGGGSGAGVTGAVNGTGGGGAGGYIEVMITSISSTYAYSVGGTAAGGTAGGSGSAGGAGAAGIIIVEEYYQ